MASRTDRAPSTRAHPPGRGPAPTRGSGGGSGSVRYLPIVFFGLGALGANAFWPIPLGVAALYLVTSILCFIGYAVDKSAAKAGRRRVPEKTLLLLGIIGGWPGAIIAQQTLRHKTQKVSFRRAFWATVLVNVVAFAVVATPLFTLVVEAARRALA
jgi:uncharacterized membrane protein YsdA (DUF1294 family)